MTRALFNSLSASAAAVITLSPALLAANGAGGDPRTTNDPPVAERHAGVDFRPTPGRDFDPPLFLDADMPQGAALPPGLYDGVLSSRPVRINAAALDPALGPNRAFDLNLTDGRRFMLVLDSCEVRGPEDYTWRGHIDGWVESDIVLSCCKDGIAAEINLAPLWRFGLRGLSGGVYLLTEVDPFKGWTCGTEEPAPTPGRPVKPADPGSLGGPEDNPIIDIMILYPQSVVEQVGANNIQAHCQLCIDQVNDACANSLRASRVRLAHHQVIAFAESDDYGDMLRRFTDDATVRQLRFNHGADLVAMLTSRTQWNGLSQTVGKAWLMQNSWNFGTYCFNSENAFSVTQCWSAINSYTFAHEIGHNMGCGHGYGDGSGLLQPESHGYRFAINLINYNTIMAYDETGGFRIRIKHYANPDVNFTGTFGTQAPTGDWEHANAWTWDRVDEFVAGYSGGASTIYGRVGAAYGMGTATCPYGDLTRLKRFTNSGGTMRLDSGTYSENPTFDTPMTIESWNGGPVLIGTP